MWWRCKIRIHKMNKPAKMTKQWPILWNILSWVILYISATHTNIYTYSTKTRVKFTFMDLPSEHRWLHIPTFLRSGLSFASAISLCNEAPTLCHRTTSEKRFSHTQWAEFLKKVRGKKWNGANAQGKYNTISTSTVARRLWSQQNTKNHALPFLFT